MVKIFDWILSLYQTDQQIIENYLSKSIDHVDLENRMRELDRGSFNGKNHSSLYRHLY